MSEPDPEALKCWAEIIGCHDPDFSDRPVIVISRYLKQARETQGKEWQEECAKLKARNEQQMRELNRLTTVALGRETHTQRVNNQQFIERQTEECDALKASNAELREQLAANAKLISELQHTIRLVQGTHAQQVRECAEAAAFRLGDCHERGEWMPRARLVAIICEAFGAPVEPKDECEEAWEQHCTSIDVEPTKSPMRKQSFWAAWKLAKGKP